MTRTDNRRAQARKDLLPRICEIAAASSRLAEWRRDAGPKAKWSNHARMQEISLFTEFERQAAALREIFIPLIPAQWDMKDWGFKPHRMGGSMSWGNKNGNGRSGFELSIQKIRLSPSISAFAVNMGALAALATHDYAATNEDARRMRALRLTNGKPMRFSFHFHPNVWREADGITPTEARAYLILRGEAPLSLHRAKLSCDPASAFEQGIQQMDDRLAQAATWSAAPAFFARLKTDKRVRKLTGGVPFAYPQSGRCGPAHVETFDRQTAMALALLDEISPEPGKMQTFLVRPRGEIGQKVDGWCPNSAMLSILLKHLFKKELGNNDMLEWEVYAMADEGGRTGRQIAAQFEPLNPD